MEADCYGLGNIRSVGFGDRRKCTYPVLFIFISTEERVLEPAWEYLIPGTFLFSIFWLLSRSWAVFHLCRTGGGKWNLGQQTAATWRQPLFQIWYKMQGRRKRINCPAKMSIFCFVFLAETFCFALMSKKEEERLLWKEVDCSVRHIQYTWWFVVVLSQLYIKKRIAVFQIAHFCTTYL